MPVWLQTVLPLLTGLLVPVFIYVFLPRLISRRNAEIDNRLVKLEGDAWTFDDRMKLESRLTALETRLEGVVNLVATRVLNNPRGPEPELRKLLVKNLTPEEDLTPDEATKFAEKLTKIEEQDPSLEKRMAARLLRTSIATRQQTR